MLERLNAVFAANADSTAASYMFVRLETPLGSSLIG